MRSRCSRRLTAALALVPLGGCDWVDSTGRQPEDALPRIEVRLDEVAPGEALDVIEETVAMVTLAGEARGEGVQASWSERLDEGGFESCAAVEGFRSDIAAATLEEACSEPDRANCRFAFEPDPSAADGRIGFSARVPRLRAPVGVRHELSATAADGAMGSSVYDFCLIAVNQAPEALDDGPFNVMEGTVLVVEPDDPRALLQNDSDDDDAGNLPLVIDPRPLDPPATSGEFELGSDGGFRYSFPESGLLEPFEDSFEYAVSDGSSSSRATVRIVVEPNNLPPVLDEPLAPLEAVVGEDFRAFLDTGFRDPEGLPLTFSTDGELPESGSLMLFPDGTLSGTPLPEDVGDYVLSYVASDGASASAGGPRETEAEVELSIVPPPNGAPEYVGGPIDNIVVEFGEFLSVPAPTFVDPDDDELVYELAGDPPFGVSFDEATGELRGPAFQVGNFTGLRVIATDPAGETAESAAFSIRVRRAT